MTSPGSWPACARRSTAARCRRRCLRFTFSVRTARRTSAERFGYATMPLVIPWLLQDPHLEDTLKQTPTMDMGGPILRHGLGGGSYMAAPFFTGLLVFLWVVAELTKLFSPVRRRRTAPPPATRRPDGDRDGQASDSCPHRPVRFAAQQWPCAPLAEGGTRARSFRAVRLTGDAMASETWPAGTTD